ncbi:MAG: hypothetical protein HY952_10240 [Elusimicrobia bacterium]|nr:hypothetical protein [Elusimicrobiota bacterium]
MTIDANVTVTAASFPINFNTLTLGGVNSPTLKLSTGTANAGSLVINNKSVFEQNSSLPLTFSYVTINSGGKLTHTPNSSSRQYSVNLNVTGDLVLQAGATIYLDWLGYASDSGPGKGFNAEGASGGGGGHGGAGGNSNAVSGGIAYDLAANPGDLGSGGGRAGSGAYAGGGSGGGMVSAVIGGTAHINGLITADGGYGYAANSGGSGGGAGGSIIISAGAIDGSGVMRANGGAGKTGTNQYGGGGGGGIIAVSVSIADNFYGSKSAFAGSGYKTGGTGILAGRVGAGAKYSITVDNASVQSSTTTKITGNAAIGSLYLARSSLVFSTFSVDSLMLGPEVSITGNYLETGDLVVSTNAGNGVISSSLTVRNNAVINSSASLVLSTMTVNGDLLLLPGSQLKHNANEGTKQYWLNLSVGGNLDLQAGATLYLDGLGYGSDSGAGKGALLEGGSGGGGGHGGSGGSANSASGGTANDVAADPADLGSGGGRAGSSGGYGGGGSGGGLLLARITGSAHINGLITANGSDGSSSNAGGSGGGAGGSINITAGAVDGSGVMRANGGAGKTGTNQYGGGGGGGIIAVSVAIADNFYGSKSAFAGSGYKTGGTGILAGRAAAGAKYSITVDNASVQSSTTTRITGNAAIGSLYLARSNLVFSTFSVDSLMLGPEVSITGNYLETGDLVVSTNAGNGVISSSLTVRNNAVINSSASLVLNTMTVNGDLLLLPGSLLKHSANAGTKQYWLNLTVGGNLDLRAGATIYLDGLGYASDSGTGKGAYAECASGSGAGHGGAGGNTNSLNGGQVYDVEADPAELGSGGGRAGCSGGYAGGGSGGGFLLAKVNGAAHINGLITADGGYGYAANSGGSGGGAGGSIVISAGAIDGSGVMRANGGAGKTGASQYGGGGGGGRLVLTYTSLSPAIISQVNGGGGYQSGGTGTIYKVNTDFPHVSTVTFGGTAIAGSAPDKAHAGDLAVTITFDQAMDTASPPSVTIGTEAPFDQNTVAGSWRDLGVWSGTFTITEQLPNGTQTLVISNAKAQNGKYLEAAATRTFALDTVSPAAPVLSAVAVAGGKVDLGFQRLEPPSEAGLVLQRSTEAAFSTFTVLADELATGTQVSVPFTDTPAADGAYYYRAAFRDTAGNTGVFSDMVSAVSDRVPPVPPSQLQTVFAGGSVLLNWDLVADAAAYNIYRTTYSAVAATGLTPAIAGAAGITAADSPSADATYYYMVTAVDAAGNEGAPAFGTLAVDLHAPVLAISGFTDGGQYNSDVAVSVAIADFSSVSSTISLNGVVVGSFTVVSAAGAYTLSVEATDAFGSSTSTVRGFVIDKTAPQFSILFPAEGLVTNQNVTAVYASTDDFTPYSSLVFRDDLGRAPPFTYSTEGVKTATFTARDLAGNVAAATVTFTIDKTGPGAVADLRFTQFLPASGKVDLAWTAPYDSLSGLASYTLKAATYPITAANFTAAPALLEGIPAQPSGSAEQFSIPVSTAQTLYFALKAADAAGNLSAVSNALIMDVQPPVISALSPSATGYLTRPVTVGAGITDDIGLASVAFYVDGAQVYAPAAPPYSFHWNTVARQDGEHTVLVRASDAAGGVTERSVVYNLQYQPPATPALTSPSSGVAIKVATFTVAGFAEAGITVQFKVDGYVAVSTQAAVNGAFSAVVTLQTEGAHALTVAAADARGASAPSAPVMVEYNFTAPGAPAGLAAGVAAAGKVPLSWNVPEGKVPSGYRVYRSTFETGLAAGTSPSQAPAASVTGLAYSDLPSSDGVYYYGVTALDASGNESPLSSIVPGVSDRTPPSAALAFSGVQPPFGAGDHPFNLTLSGILASAPVLVFTPPGMDPVNVPLSASSPTVWIGTLSVTQAMSPGNGRFAFQGKDLAGNTGTAISAGSVVALDLAGPSGAVELVPASPVKAGEVFVTLRLSEPAAYTPNLVCRPAAGDPITVVLSGSGELWSGILNVPQGADGQAAFIYNASDQLGNLGTSLSAGGVFTIDTVPPGAPLYARASAKTAGAVELNWSSPIGGTPWRYKVHRDGVEVSSSVAPKADGSGTYLETPVDGEHSYTVLAVDAAGNEGPLSQAAQVTARSTPPAAPLSLNAALNQYGRAELSWQPGDADAASYAVYRTTYQLVAAAGASGAPVSQPPYVDTPEKNGLYHYAVSAFDYAGNESALSQEILLNWDKAPPVITITGAADGAIYNYAPAPAFSAADGVSPQITIYAKLDNVPFLSGAVVAAEGEHTLVVTAVGQSLASSTRTVHFTVDLTSPAVSIAGAEDGAFYSSEVVPVISASDARLAAVQLVLDGAAYTAGVPVSSDGRHLLSATARDLAGNISVASAAFTLDLPPPAPAGFTFNAQETAGAVLTWNSPAADTAGYRVYKDGQLHSQGLVRELNYSDPAFVQGEAHVYGVSAVDAAGHEGARAVINIPAVTFTLDSYGVADSSSAVFVRGFFDTARLRLGNNGPLPQLIGPVTAALVSGGVSAQAPAVSVAAGGSALVSPVLPVPAELPASSQLRVTLALPAGIGSAASFTRIFTVAAVSPREPIVELLTEPLVRGMNSRVQVKFNNKGSAPLEIKTWPGDIAAQLSTPEGTTLAQGRLQQIGGGAQPCPGGYFVQVGAQSSYIFEPISLFVPAGLGDSGQVSAVIERVYSGLAGSSPAAGARVFSATVTLSGVAEPPYSATVVPERAVYDQGTAVKLAGSALLSGGSLLPGATVQIGVLARGYERTASTVTDASGHYELTFAPTPGESGIYSLWAAYPGVLNRMQQSSFTIVGFGFQYSDYSASLVQNSSVAFRVNLLNSGQTPLAGLTASVEGSAAGVALSLDQDSLPAGLGSGQSAPLSFTASASAAAAVGTYNFTVNVEEADGYRRSLPVKIAVAAASPVPSASPNAFKIGMSAGQTRTLTVTLLNNGMADWKGMYLAAPSLAWVSFTGNTAIGDIPPGGSAVVTLKAAPPAGLASQAFASNPLFEARSSNAAPLPVSSLITITASGLGNAVYNVINADKPAVNGAGTGIAGAEAELISLDVAGLSAKGTADANGVIQVLNVPAGRYSYTVRAAGFENASGVETIEPGVTLQRDVALPTDVVSYEWTVTPTTIADTYNVSLSITFKTDVPAPALAMSSPLFNFELPEEGGGADGQFTLTNNGLVSARNIELNSSGDAAMSVYLPYSSISELRPGASVVVPFHVALAHASCHSGTLGGNYKYTAACGQTMTKSLPSAKVNAGQCASIGASTNTASSSGGFIGGGGGTGGGGASGVSISVPSSFVSYVVANPPAVTPTSKMCREPAEKRPSECVSGVCVDGAAYSDAGGDPRIPVADLSVELPSLGGALPFARVYDSLDMDAGAFGRSWLHSFESRVALRYAGSAYFTGAGGTAQAGIPAVSASGAVALRGPADVLAEVRPPDGRRLVYTANPDGSFAPPSGESSTLAVIGSTAAPEGFAWTTPGKTVYRYDASGRLVSITDNNDSAITLEYGGGRLTAVKDPEGRTVYSFVYNQDGTLASVTDLGGRSAAFGYADGMLASADGPEGHTAYAYGAYGIDGLAAFGAGVLDDLQADVKTLKLITGVTSPNGHVTSFTYGAPAQVVDYVSQASAINTGTNYTGASTGELSFWGFSAQPVTAGKPELAEEKYYYAPLLVTQSGYALDKAAFARWYFPQVYVTTGEIGSRGAFTFRHTMDELLGIGSTEVTDPLGRKSTYKWEVLSGRAVGMERTDPAGGATATAYDTRRNPVQVTDRAGRVTQFVYDSKNNVTAVIDPLANRTNFTYEPIFNGLASVMDPRGNSSSFGYDAKGNLTSAQDALGNAVQIAYDAHGLPVSITDPLNHTVTITRDGNGYATQITDPLTRSAHMGYNNIGRVVSFTDGANRQTQFAYDTADNLTQVTDAINGATHYNYTAGIIAEGKLLSSLEDAKSHTTQFGYDTRGRLTSVTNPLNQSRSYEYDEANNLTKVTKADGVQITFEYDNLNRLTKKNIPGDPVAYAYDAASNLISAEDNASKIQIGYDAGDRPTRVIQTNKAANLTSQLDYEYDANGNRTKMTLAANPAPFVWNYTYDNLNRLTRITTPDNTNIAFEYDAMSRRTRMGYPNGTEANYTYDNASQLTGITHKRTADNTIIAQANYQYDTAGNRTSMTDTAGTHSYGYDDLHRLTSASHPTASALDVKNEIFNYDGVGNRLNDAVRSNYTYDAANRLNSDSLYDYTYDQNGNRNGETDKATNAHTAYSYNAKDQFVSATMPDGTAATYKYDTQGRRMEKVVSSGTVTTTTRYVYDGNDVIAVLDGNNALNAMFTHGPKMDEPLVIKHDGQNYFYHAVGVQNVAAITDNSSAIVETMEYQAYGKPVVENRVGAVFDKSTIGNIFLYAGREYDAETGFINDRARVYASKTGVFLQEDPLRNINQYAYVGNNPITRMDPLGLDWIDDAANAGAGYGDGLTMGLTRLVREKLLNLHNIDYCSDLYRGEFAVGMGVSTVAGFFTGASEINAAEVIQPGTRVYRVWGDGAGPWGKYWTTVDPGTIPNYRSVAGLPSVNSGRFVSEGVLANTEGVVSGRASTILPGQTGGLNELRITNPEAAVVLDHVSGANPGF